MTVEGYEQLAAVLQDAYDQAAKGKGALRRVGRVMRTGRGRMKGHVMDWVVVRAA